MVYAELFEEIATAFPGSATSFSDSFIEENPDLFELDDRIDFRVAVPAYMGWCARNGHKRGQLVHDYTVRALAEFGRSKNLKLARLNFKHTCSAEQKQIVLTFLRWSLDPDHLLDAVQVERSLKRWSAC